MYYDGQVIHDRELNMPTIAGDGRACFAWDNLPKYHDNYIDLATGEIFTGLHLYKEAEKQYQTIKPKLRKKKEKIELIRKLVIQLTQELLNNGSIKPDGSPFWFEENDPNTPEKRRARD